VLVQRGVVAGFQQSDGGQAGLQRGGGERGQERPGDRGVDRGAAGPQVPAAAAGNPLINVAIPVCCDRCRSVARPLKAMRGPEGSAQVMPPSGEPS